MNSSEKIQRMIRPEELKKDVPLLWSTGTGTDVWDLFCGCISGDLDRVRQLMSKDPSLVRCHYRYRTPMYFAVRENQVEVAEFLLDQGADPLGLAVNDSLVQITRDRGYAEMEKLLEEKYTSAYTARRRKENRLPLRFGIATLPKCGNSLTQSRNSFTRGMSAAISRFIGPP